LRHLHRDHIGSVVVLTDETGAIAEHQDGVGPLSYTDPSGFNFDPAPGDWDFGAGREARR
jgi:glyoxylase-like metal-dependent hydrolase (beta-lactamase superfamily II)